jgi:hypothetical protein
MPFNPIMPALDPSHLPTVNGTTEDPLAFGVLGQNDKGGTAVAGASRGTGFGLLAGTDPVFKQHAGVYGHSDQQGVMGLTTVPKGTGVYGGGTPSAAGDQIGVRGETFSGVGVQGESFGEGVAIQGQSLSGDKGLAGRFIGNVHVQGNPGTSSGDLRVEGTSSFGGHVSCDGDVSCGGIGKFTGNVEVAGDITLTTGQDCAEEFDVAATQHVEPGTVMVIKEDGTLQQSDREYDKKVAGVVCGAGDYRPAIVLGKLQGRPNRIPIALLGKVYCKVDARFSPIEVCDLLTTSPTPGHAMKADDPSKALGTLIGKALRRLDAGQGMIPILVALQ